MFRMFFQLNAQFFSFNLPLDVGVAVIDLLIAFLGVCMTPTVYSFDVAISVLINALPYTRCVYLRQTMALTIAWSGYTLQHSD